MYRPDRVILRKIREFDPHLFVEWNTRRQFFEIWRRGVWGRRRVTTVTRALYEPGAPQTFVPLDERILGCLYEPWGSGSHIEWFDRQNERELEEERLRRKRMREDARALGREMWHGLNNRFVTTHASKNTGRPTFNHANPYQQWVRPDVQARTSPRLFQRSSQNARLYGYRGK